MTAFERVRRTQRALGLVVSASALIWAAAVLFGLLAITGLVVLKVAMPPIMYVVLPAIAVIGALVTLGVVLWRERFVWTFDRVALWIEERAPELRYALVTAIDPRYRNTPEGKQFEPVVDRVDTGSFVRTAAKQLLLPAILALGVAIAAYVFVPKSTSMPSLSEILKRGPSAVRPVGNRIAAFTATVTPPAYANMRTMTLNTPSTISALQGSRVTLTGVGEPDRGMRFTLGDRDLPISAGGKGWVASFVMSDSAPTALKLTDRQYRSIIVIDPQIDEAPAARLMIPQRDTTLRDIPKTLHVSADLTDEIGLGSADFEYIVANLGEGDDSKAREGKLGTRSFNGAKQATFDLTIPYASLNLQEGDLLSIRAVVTDNNNTVTGPKRGYSETRVIRIAKKSEYDSINITPSPPSADTALMTLRMLIIATQKLDSSWKKTKSKMDTTSAPFKAERTKYIDSSYKLAQRAEWINRTIKEIIKQQTGDGEVPVDSLLNVATNAMWDAAQSLYIARTDEAIPKMIIALQALQKYSNQAKYYLRGRQPPVIVNIDRVRLKGNDTGQALPRGQIRAIEGTERERLRTQYTQAIGYLKTQPQQAIEVFTLMRVATLRTQPALAAALGDAVTALQHGKDATLPLVKARHVLDGSAGAIDSLPAWSGAW